MRVSVRGLKSRETRLRWSRGGFLLDQKRKGGAQAPPLLFSPGFPDAHKTKPSKEKLSRVLKGGAWQWPTFTGNTTDYHWRESVSPSCSEWEGVGPLCYGRQAKALLSKFFKDFSSEFFGKEWNHMACFSTFTHFFLFASFLSKPLLSFN